MTIADPRPNSQSVLAELFALAHAQVKAGRLDVAAAIYQKIIALTPDNFEAIYFLANTLLVQGQLEEAAEQYDRALAIRPDLAEAHNNLGGILYRQGKLEEALARFRQAIALKPSLAEAHNNLGGALKDQGLLDQAAAEFNRALELRPNLAEAHNNLGGIFQKQGRLDAAVVHFRQAFTLRTDLAEPHKNLANALVQQGNLTEAAEEFRRAIALKPDYAEAHHDRCDLKTFQRDDPDLAALEALVADEHRLPPGKMAYIHFALGKAWEDVGDYPRAFEHFRQGNALKRREIDFNETASRLDFQTIAETFDTAAIQRFRAVGDPSTLPIFVVGMPRSGSTLVEQILASHSQVHAAGELENLSRIVQAAPGSADMASMTDRDDGYAAALRRLAEAYLASLPSVAEGKTRIIDKAPGNFFNIGLIHLVLPGARIIHTTRCPIDTCVSCFTRLFTDGQQFSYDLGELGRYFCRYQELMAHWRSVLPPGSLLDVAYEDVVDDLEGQARRLVEFCGLPWDPACLNFHQSRRTVSTASNVQVRRPLYRTSLARWRRYEAFLEPLLAELNACGAI